MNHTEAAQERVLREFAQTCDAERAKLVEDLAALMTSRDQLIRETGARLRVLMPIVMIAQETFTALVNSNNAPIIVIEALTKMNRLLDVLKQMPAFPVTPLT